MEPKPIAFTFVMEHMVVLDDTSVLNILSKIEREAADRGLYNLNQRTFGYALQNLQDLSDDYFKEVHAMIEMEKHRRYLEKHSTKGTG